MKVISLNTGKPQPYRYRGKLGYTSIFKYPAEGERKVTFLNIEGDEQGDLTVHGGKEKAVYSYDMAYYDHWKTVIERKNWPPGLFGENLTTKDLTDDKVLVGDIYRVGTVVLKAVQPRFPCFKLNIRFGIDNMLQLFMEQQKSGIYYSLVEEGNIKAGDEITLIDRTDANVSIQQLVECYNSKGKDRNLLEQVLTIDILPKD